MAVTNPLADVKQWLYHLGDINANRAREIGGSTADLVVIDYANYAGVASRQYTSAEVDVMRGKNDKLIVSYISIGEAEDYRPYWRDSWNKTPPSFVSASNPEWPDNYNVKYWDPAWKSIIFEYVDDIVKAGFNGLYLDIIDAFAYWQEIAPNSGINYKREMATFVAEIRSRAEQTLAELGDARRFAIIGQNGEELIANATYRAAIDGLAKEDLRFFYPNDSESSFRPVPSGWFEGSKEYLERAEADGVEVFVVEYMTKARQTRYADTLRAEIDYLKSREIPFYVAEDRDLTRIYVQPPGVGGPGAPILGTPGADNLIGTDLADEIHGRGGSDRIDGRDGGDAITGDAGKDRLSGGAGGDRLSGGSGDDSLYGGDGSDKLYGGANEDRLSGGAGGDRLSGGSGDDSLYGGDGSDKLYGGASEDRLSGGAGGDRLSGGSGDDSLYGGDGSDKLYGGASGDRLSGGAGGDRLSGGSGDDSLYGGDGSDKLYGGASEDRLSGGMAGDRLSGGSSDDALFGGRGDDTLYGGTGEDRLVGGPGADRVVGGAGNDLLTGGDGADVFVFGPGSGDDVVTDLVLGTDKLLIADATPYSVTETVGGVLLSFADGRSIELVGLAPPDIGDGLFL